MTLPQKLPRAIALLTVLLVAPLVIWNGVSDQALLPQYMAWCLGLVLALAVLLAELFRGGAGARGLSVPKFLLPMLLFIPWAGLTCLWTRNPWEGLFEWSKLLFCILWALAFVRLVGGAHAQLRWVPRLAALALAAALTYGYFQLFRAGIQEGGLSHFITYRVDSFFAHRNLFSEAMVLLLPCVVWVALRESGLWRILGLTLTGLSLAMVLVLQVRSAWLALAVAGLIGLLAGVPALWRSGEAAKLRRPIIAMLVLATFAVASGAYLYQTTRKSKGLDWVGKTMLNPTFGSASERLVMWQKTLHLIEMHPILGCGLNGWRIELPGLGYAHLRKEVQQGTVMVDRTHNDFLQVTAETGIPGGLLWLGSILLPLLIGTKVIRSTMDMDGKLLTVGAMASIGAFATISCFSFPMERISHMIFLGTNLGCLGVLGSDSMHWRLARRPSLIILLVAMAATLGGALLGWARIRADRQLMAGLACREARDWSGMLRAMEAGHSPFTCIDPTGTPYKWYIGSARFQLGDYPGALLDFQQAFIENPHHLHVLNNLGATWVQLGQLDSGLVYCQAAVGLSPRFSDAWNNVATIHFNLNHLDLAEAAILNVQDSTPSRLSENIGQVIVSARIVDILPKIDTGALHGAIDYMYTDPSWRLSVFHKARLNHLSLAEQIVIEASFSLLNGERRLTFDQVDSLRAKYLPPGRVPPVPR